MQIREGKIKRRRAQSSREVDAGMPRPGGEIMPRLDRGDGRVRTTRTFRVSEDGGKYNVLRGLRSVIGICTTIESNKARDFSSRKLLYRLGNLIFSSACGI